MIRILLEGRLGNHLFQIATALALARRRRTGVVVDACLVPEVTGEVTLRRLPALKLGFPRRLASVTVDRISQAWWGRHTYEMLRAPHYREPSHAYDPSLLALGPQTVLQGYFQCERYFATIADELRRWFDLGAWLERAPAQCRAAVVHPQSVGIHVRRTDYLLDRHRHIQVCDPAYYARAIKRFRNSLPGAAFVVISDDPEWCRSHFNAADIFVSDTRGDPYAMLVDLALLSACRHQIIANSSFSWWGAWLNANPDRRVIAPDRWTHDRSVPIETKSMTGFETIACGGFEPA